MYNGEPNNTGGIMTNTVKNFMSEFSAILPERKIFIVGGAVRDLIMTPDAEPNDYDFATDASIDELDEWFSIVDIGQSRDFGIVSVQYKGESFEVAQFRTDTAYTNGRHPDAVVFDATIEDDARRRDFTINAMYMDADGNIMDFHDGMADIQQGNIKCVGNPIDRFEEDALRILRAVRFSVTYDMHIDDKTASAIKLKAHNINHLTQERITGEIMKMATKGGVKFFKYLETLEDLSLMSIIFPEIWNMRDYNHAHIHHPEGALMRHSDFTGFLPLSLKALDEGWELYHAGSVYDHMMSCMNQLNEDDSLEVIIGTLYHDIGKPISASLKDEEYGTYSFKRHEYLGKNVWGELCAKRKFNNDIKDVVKFCIEHHMNCNNSKLKRKGTILELALSPYFETLKRVCYADDASRGPEVYDEARYKANMKKLDDFRDTYIDESAFKSKVKGFINGGHVMKLRNMEKPSREVGDVIKFVTDKLIECDFNIDQAEVDKMVINYKGE